MKELTALLVEYETEVTRREMDRYKEATGTDINYGGMLEYKVEQHTRLVNAAHIRTTEGKHDALAADEIEKLWAHQTDGSPVQAPEMSPEAVHAAKSGIAAKVLFYQTIISQGNNFSPSLTVS
ncbi:MAG: hypothetical protein KKD17_04515 [Nanoarchaeota archaeon]|nr:hypothetical protein [Bacteroidota bacterium]MBU2561537.1 hypothetical protein [Nanoarchaeota archaeon]